MSKKNVIGIDLGGTGTKFGVVDSAGVILEQSSISTPAYATPEDFVDDLAKHLSGLVRNHGGPLAFSGIGIGAPNGNFYRGVIDHAPNLRWKGIVPLAAMVEESMNLSTKLTNDANAAALGEMIYGAARGMRDFFVVTLGTGVGSGIVSNGEVVYGKTGFAGELGHVIVVRDGRRCGCGRNGCLETYTSATGLSLTALEQLGSELTAQEVASMAHGGNAKAQRIYQETGRILGEALADAAVLFSPEAIFLSGGVAKAGELIFGPTQEHFEKNLLNIFQKSVRLLPSALPESDAAILGAAAIVS